MDDQTEIVTSRALIPFNVELLEGDNEALQAYRDLGVRGRSSRL